MIRLDMLLFFVYMCVCVCVCVCVCARVCSYMNWFMGTSVSFLSILWENSGLWDMVFFIHETNLFN